MDMWTKSFVLIVCGAAWVTAGVSGVSRQRSPVSRSGERPLAPMGEQSAQTLSGGRISDFDDGRVAAAFGAGWQISTDSMRGGASDAKMTIVRPGAAGSAAALEITGAIRAGAEYPWAGAMFFPAATPMAPVDLSTFKELVFWARGDGRQYQVMLFTTRFGNIPVSQPFTAEREWRQHALPLKAFSGTDGADVRGILFSADAAAGAFAFAIDGLLLR